MNDSITSGRRSEKEIFFAALEKRTPEERAAFLDGACGTNPVQRAKVEALLANHFQPAEFMKAPALEAPTSVLPASPPAEAPAQMLGRYKLLEKIGEGGFGEVWMAEQREPVKRRVALKIIKLGMDSRQIVARFEAERQALAMMDHANIAKIFDADVTDTGRPYFVMELVRGIKITEYCDQNQIPTQERLELFIDVCKAIQHAHQKGIIHRDIKPSNILVTLHDGVPVPKVIDFGIAKATQQELTDKTVFTQFQQFIGTPAYISPEQAEMSGLDIDTRADIYSLGVLLYELLVGQTPFDAKEMMKGGLDALRRMIREKEAPRPSTKLKTLLGDDLTSTAQRRHTDPAHLSHQLRGDLDWIVMKCLEKDRTRRYDTANGLAMDIQRHLANEPVVARPPSTAYRIQKAWQRNKLVFTSATFVALALIVGTGVSTWQAVRATRANQAEVQQRLAAQTAQANAQQKQQEAEQEKQRADRAATEAQRTAYSAQMLVAQADWDNGNFGHLKDLLKETESYTDRGYEWYYWQRMCRLEARTFRCHDKLIHAIAFSPDGRRFVSGSDDGTAKVFDSETGRELVIFTNQNGRVQSLAYSPDGRWIATGTGPWSSGTNLCKIWEAETGREVSTLDLPGEGARVTFTPDSKRIVSTCLNGTVLVWNVATGRKLRILDLGNAYCSGDVAFSKDGQFLLLSGRGVKILDAQSYEVLQTIEEKMESPYYYPVWPAAFSPDGRRILSLSSSLIPKVTEWTTGKVIASLHGHAARVTSAGFSPDGQRIVTGSLDRMVKVWDASTGQELFGFRGHPQGVTAVAFFADDERVLSAGADGMVKVWDYRANPDFISLKGHATRVQRVAFSPDNGRIVSGSDDGTVKVWEVQTGRPLGSFKPHSGELAPNSVAFSPNGQRILSGHWDRTVCVWDAKTGEVLLKKTYNTALRGPRSVAYSPNGRRIAAGVEEGPILIWDAETGREIQQLPPRRGWNASLAFSPDSKRIISTSIYGDQRLRIWEVETGHELPAFEDSDGLSVAACSPNGRWIAGGTHEGTIKVWETETGRRLPAHSMSFKGHAKPISSLAFSPDSRRIVSGSDDMTVRLWDSETGREMLTLKGPKDGVPTVAFSPDGRRIISGSRDSTVTMWIAADPADVSRWQQEEREANESQGKR